MRITEMNCEVEKTNTVPRGSPLNISMMYREIAYISIYSQNVRPANRRPRDSVASRMTRISASAPASYSCVGCSGTFNGVPTLAAAYGLVNVIAHGTVVGLP